MLDELRDLQVFYINIGGGEPMVRRDFFELVEYSIGNGIGVKFSTNGAFIDAAKAAPAGGDGLPRHPDQPRRHRRGHQRRGARRRLLRHRPAGDGPPRRGRLRTVQDLRRRHPPQRRPARRVQGARRLVRRAAAGHPPASVAAAAPTRGTTCIPTNAQQRQIYDWLLAHGDNVLTGDSFFHLNALGEPLPGLNMCGAGRVVCLIDPIGDVYACPFVIHDQFKAGSVRDDGRLRARSGSTARCSASCASRSRPARAQLRQLRRVPGRLHGRQVLHRPAARRPRPRVRQRPRRARCSPVPALAPRPAMDHSKPQRARNRVTFLTAVSQCGLALLPAAYLLGTFPSAVLVARGQRHRHHGGRIRQPGRVQRHPRARMEARACSVFVLDALKGAIAAGLGLLVDGRRGRLLCCGAAAIVGHMFPVSDRGAVPRRQGRRHRSAA